MSKKISFNNIDIKNLRVFYVSYVGWLVISADILVLVLSTDSHTKLFTADLRQI